MKTIVILLNLFSFQNDTVVFDYGDLLYMTPDEYISGSYKLKPDLPDGVYLILDNYGGEKKFKRQEVVIQDSTVILDIQYYENMFFVSRYSFETQPPVKEKFELIDNQIEKYMTYYKNGVIKSIEILDTELESQKLLSERFHYENGGLKMLLTKDNKTNRYLINYYYDTGELLKTGQFDEFNRPVGVWTTYYENGNIKMEGKVCADCVKKLWRPWTNTPVDYKEGIWTYYSADGNVLETRDESDNER